MVTDAEVTLNGREATLQKGSQLLNAKILSPASARFDVLSTQAPPGETLNGNTRKLVVRLPDLVVRLPDKVESLRLVVALTPYRRDSAAPKLDWADRPLDTW